MPEFWNGDLNYLLGISKILGFSIVVRLRGKPFPGRPTAEPRLAGLPSTSISEAKWLHTQLVVAVPWCFQRKGQQPIHWSTGPGEGPPLGPIGDLVFSDLRFAFHELRWSLLKRAGVYSAEDGVTLDQLREVQAGQRGHQGSNLGISGNQTWLGNLEAMELSRKTIELLPGDLPASFD